MHEPAAIDQDILQQIDSALRRIEQTGLDPDPDPECPAGGRGTRWLLALFACLIVIYHADHVLAQVIEGETSDGHGFVSWEYDLESGMGQVLIHNIDVPLEDSNVRLYLTGLIPEHAENLQHLSAISIDPCPGSGAPPRLVFADLNPGEEALIDFNFCDGQTQSGVSLPPCSLIQAQKQAVEKGLGYAWSGACFFLPQGALQEFVTVRPIECGDSDRDEDNDVDLQDFANFQANTPPEQLPCYDLFYDELTGPR